MDISKFKSDLLEHNYEYQGSSKDKAVIDFNNYKKNSNKKEINIFYISDGDLKKNQIFFITRE